MPAVSSAGRLGVCVVLALAASGCDRYAADPGVSSPAVPTAPGEGAPPPAAATAASMYVKGPAEIPGRGAGAYRTQSVPGAVRYSWVVTSERLVELSAAERDARLVFRDGPGRVTLRVQAVDAEGRVVGAGKREILVGD